MCVLFVHVKHKKRCNCINATIRFEDVGSYENQSHYSDMKVG
jgi:hypothetical protein